MKMDINGMTYAFEISGTGQPLLLLHGFTGSMETWRPFIKMWKEKFQVIIIDLPGHGQTDSPDDVSRYRMESTCFDLNVFLDRLGIENVYLLGYSMGGRVALSFTCLYPNRVKKLVFESSSPGLEGKLEREERVFSDEKLAKLIEEKGVEYFVHYWENIPLFQTQKTLPYHLRQKIRKERMGQNPRGLANSLRGMGTGTQPSWWHQLNKIQIPVQLIVGEKDSKFCRIGKRMESALPNAQYVEIENAGHAIHVEKSEIFGKIVMDFFMNKEGIH
ncbi:2-succinyl-6-hydroxy-2,4-cyclohexadiene-1-carboxylate synthase [Fervidibacillus halotolerans]|uniref:Putative 2-succinyl-6-hydroxy-2,4-cyclohexadiene-1-carboxylate synthase n=1 Tax=Fervidibacillus halotolerans TaxID=2980027 RepID=A0A9E8M2M9_9BACI|nr:2-succinyl-6-hydroxy-2,4-cyclohexadiene-1-carboxylate synthase [Fervidibacillus halotolerans]WAA13955.1 2-succinyl-6-hydroxy-2,4-cyclohexadiene-1-carboxylate synthase [Fervidibacillus halotolerans]